MRVGGRSPTRVAGRPVVTRPVALWFPRRAHCRYLPSLRRMRASSTMTVTRNTISRTTGIRLYMIAPFGEGHSCKGTVTSLVLRGERKARRAAPPLGDWLVSLAPVARRPMLAPRFPSRVRALAPWESESWPILANSLTSRGPPCYWHIFHVCGGEGFRSVFRRQSAESDESDFEGGLIRACAELNDVSFILTRDGAAFRRSRVRAVSAKEYLEICG